MHAGERGKMVALRGAEIEVVELAEAVGTLKVVPKELYDVAKVFFG
jgi:6-phosphofructokinase 1